MATYYWVGGSGNWDATTTTNWAASSGGAGGAGVPTSADNVVFDGNSNTGTNPFTVTVTGTSTAPSLCNDFSTSSLDGVMTLTSVSNGYLDCYGSLTLPATNLTWTGGYIRLRFMATTTGKTITTNGVTLTETSLELRGVAGGWTLGSALTITGTVRVISVIDGTFNTGNYAIAVGTINKTETGTATINLGSSAITLDANSPVNFSTPTGLTLNAGTSTITCSAANPIFTGGGLTYYNVTFSNVANGTTTVNNANTFNNLTQTSRSGTGRRGFILGANQIVNGTLTLGAANTSIRRIQVYSDTIGTQRTITLNGTLATLADVDFRDIVAAGTAGTWTGTRIGNALNNSGITFDAAKTVYRRSTGNWSATQWALTSGGTAGANNFPLPQDTMVFDTNTTTGTHTIDQNWWLGALNCSAANTAITIASGTTTPTFYKDITLDSDITLSGTGVITLSGQGTTQSVTSAGVSFTQPITVNSPLGTVKFLDALTVSNTFTHANGTVQLKNGATTTVTTFATSGTTQKYLQSTTAGSQATLSQASGTVDASYLTIQDINATGGATWNAYVDQNNVDAGNVDGWDFGISPVVGGAEYTYRIRSFTEPRRF